jgi:hypothetical protein
MIGKLKTIGCNATSADQIDKTILSLQATHERQKTSQLQFLPHMDIQIYLQTRCIKIFKVCYFPN